MSDDHKAKSEPDNKKLPLNAASPTFIVVVGLLGTFLGLVTFVQSSVHNSWAPFLIVVVGLAALYGTVLMIMRLRARLGSLGARKLGNGLAIALAFAAFIVVLVGGGLSIASSVTNLSHHEAAPTPSPSHSVSTSSTSASPHASNSGATAAPGTQVQGTITWPLNGATNVKHAQTLYAMGTVRNLEPGHQLLLFLNFADEAKYYGGNPSPPITMTNGKWSDSIFIGGDMQPGQHFMLYLIDMDPQDRAFVDNESNPDWNGGVGFPPRILFGTGERVLSQITFTTD